MSDVAMSKRTFDLRGLLLLIEIGDLWALSSHSPLEHELSKSLDAKYPFGVGQALPIHPSGINLTDHVFILTFPKS